MCHAPATKFLLMKHKHRWDLPKGHVDPGETDLQTAFRELEEETGIPESEVELDSSFLYQQQYPVPALRYTGESARTLTKTLLIYLGYVVEERPIKLTEHPGYQWFDWDPPHQIQSQTIDPLLSTVAQHLG